MESKRQLKFGKLIQKDLSEIFQKEAASVVAGALVTVTGVRVSPDLGLARVYLSVLPESKRNDILEQLDLHAASVRNALAKKVRHQMRIIPSLKYFLDNSMDEMEKMNALFKDLVIPPAEEEEKNSTEE